MGTDIKQMYLDLNELLQDICQFLSGGKLTNLSPKDQNLVESLINRSKKQLQEIAKIQINQNNEEYMVMDKKVLVTEKEEDKINIYSSVDDDFTKKIEVTVVDENICPYEDLPARAASKYVKYGDIYMKRKFLLGFEKMKRVYGSIHEGWLLIYFSDRDTKPICTLNLRNYEAKICDGDKMDFHLIGLPGKKTYNFEALTQKDMKQWVTQINKFYDQAMMRDMDPENDITYEEASDNESDVYETLKMDQESKKPTNKSPFRVKPLLPGRPSVNYKAKKPIKVPPPVIKNKVVHHSSEEDSGSYDEIGIPEKSSNKSLSDSTKSLEDIRSDSSEDREESIYERFVTIQGKVSNLRNGIEAGRLGQENNDAANKVIPCSSFNQTNPTVLANKPTKMEPPPALPMRRLSWATEGVDSFMDKDTISDELSNNSFLEDSDDDNIYDQLTPVKKDIVNPKVTETNTEHKGRPPVSAKPKMPNKPSVGFRDNMVGMKLSILTSVKTVKH